MLTYFKDENIHVKNQNEDFVCVCFKELERNLELSANSFQRQMAAERRRTLSAQEEIHSLQEELQRVTNRLKVSALKKNPTENENVFVRVTHTG